MNDEFYNSTKWKKKRAKILRRDKYQCQRCKRYGKLTEATMVHHIIEIEEDPSLALVDSNLVSLCKACHEKQHPEKAQKASRYRKSFGDPYKKS